jgi:hypothetical protein
MGTGVLDGTLRRLENLGFIRKTSDSQFELSNYFFGRWLQEIDDHNLPSNSAASTMPINDEEQLISNRDNEESPGGLMAEMKRRSVFRVGIAYVAVAWVLLQVGEIVFEFLEVPTWAGKLLIVFLGLGLPVALFLAWAFELTPEGVKREADVDRSTTTTRPSRRKLDLVIIVILAIAVIFFAFDKFA